MKKYKRVDIQKLKRFHVSTNYVLADTELFPEPWESSLSPEVSCRAEKKNN